jgi:hypothetical protein
MTVDRPWLPVPLYAKIMKISKDSAHRDIRRGTFPFRTEIISGRIHVSARDMGLEVRLNEETQDQEETLASAA